MTKIVVEKNRTTMLEVTTSNNTIIVEKGNVFDSESHGIVESGSPSGNDYRINGTIIADGSGDLALSFEGNDTNLSVGEHGKLKSNGWALRAFGDESKVVNAGRIQADTVAVVVGGEDMHIVNHGSLLSSTGFAIDTMQVGKLRLDNSGILDSKFGLDLRVEDLTLNFGKDSVVAFHGGGTINTNSEAGWVARINNAGEITNSQSGLITAITGGAGQEIVRNSGSIKGFVTLDAGDDRYDGRGGRVHGGWIQGGEGDDTYIISNAKDYAAEAAGEGHDKLKVTCSYSLGDGSEIELTRLKGHGDFNLTGNALDNKLAGNSGDNRLIGGAGSDGLWGGAGRDVITGGANADAFYFKHNAGVEIITDFHDGDDILVLSIGDDIKSINDLLAHHMHQDGKDLVISGDGTEMILKNVDRADITAMDWDT